MKVVDEADEVLAAMRGIVSAPLPLQVLLQTGPEHLTSCELAIREGTNIHVCIMHMKVYKLCITIHIHVHMYMYSYVQCDAYIHIHTCT